MQLQLDLSFLILLQTFNSIQNGNESVKSYALAWVCKTFSENLRQLTLKYDFDKYGCLLTKKNLLKFTFTIFCQQGRFWEVSIFELGYQSELKFLSLYLIEFRHIPWIFFITDIWNFAALDGRCGRAHTIVLIQSSETEFG